MCAVSAHAAVHPLHSGIVRALAAGSDRERDGQFPVRVAPLGAISSLSSNTGSPTSVHALESHMERPAWAPRSIDISVPSVSRIYDYYLGGSHNFEVDREAARKAMGFMPGLPKIMQANRAFMRRAVRYAADEGITQFLDIGSGIPTFGNVHEVAQAAVPGARVVYVDHDPVAVAHSQAVLAGNEDADMAAADLRRPEEILASPQLERLIDLNRPVALLLVAICTSWKTRTTRTVRWPSWAGARARQPADPHPCLVRGNPAARERAAGAVDVC